VAQANVMFVILIRRLVISGNVIHPHIMNTCTEINTI